jgi:hypothetical protein
MKCAIEMVSGAVKYTPSFMKIGSGVQTLIGGFTDTQHGDRRSQLYEGSLKSSSCERTG